jgi:hypothetical protein
MAKALCETRSELRSIDRQTTFKRIERLLQRGFVKGSSRVISVLLQRGSVKGSSRVISGPQGVDEGGHQGGILGDLGDLGDHGDPQRT